jgi:hypothetical protein
MVRPSRALGEVLRLDAEDDEKDDAGECFRERDRDRDVDEPELLLDPDRLPPGLRILGTSQSAPIARRALYIANIASAGAFRLLMPNCHFVGRGFFAESGVNASGLFALSNRSCDLLCGFNLRAVAALSSAVCSRGEVDCSAMADGFGPPFM